VFSARSAISQHRWLFRDSTKADGRLAPCATEPFETRAATGSDRVAPFADETPHQIARHREIARRYRSRRDGSLITRLRVAELERAFESNYGGRQLPDDDAGRADLRLIADHLAQIDPCRIRRWAAEWMPTLTQTELDNLIAEVGSGRWWKADALARELRLDDATRTRLNIRTIGAVDCKKAKRKARRRRKRIAAERERRFKAGANPHAESAERQKPWAEMGISRATYYRQRAQKTDNSETVETETRPIVRSTYTEKNASLSGLDVGGTHSVAASPPIAKPLPLRFRVGGPSDQAAAADAVGLEKIARTCLEVVASSIACSSTPEKLNHLLIAASGVWARAKRESNTSLAALHDNA